MKKDELLGIYIGMAVGDALGAPYEFLPPVNDVDSIGMVGGGVHECSIGEWTDDTAMARCITHSYLRNKGHLVEASIYKNFFKWMTTGEFGTRDYCFDIGNTCRFSILKAQLSLNLCGDNYVGSQANGGIMRMAPVILVNHRSLNNCILDGIRQSMLTHSSPACIKYAEHLARDLFTGSCNGDYAQPEESTGWVESTYGLAWECVKSTKTFKDAVIKAVSYGGDADTVGAVTGMIAGRKYGYSSIPPEWLDVLYGHEQLVREAMRLIKIKEV